MEKRIKDTFEEVKMPDRCVRRIERAIQTSVQKEEDMMIYREDDKHRVMPVLACCLVAVLLIGGIIMVYGTPIPDRTATQPATEPTERYEEESRLPGWLKWDEEGHLWLIPGDGTRLDTTGQFSYDEPYTHIEYVDGELHSFFAVGGTLDDIGYTNYSFLSGTGYSVNHCEPVTGEIYGWCRIAEEQFRTMHNEMMGVRNLEEALRKGMTYEQGDITYTVTAEGFSMEFDETMETPYTEIRDGRVYFIANAENVDITDLISMETPYTYIYTDQKRITHYIAIGGTADCLGWSEMLHKDWDELLTGYLGALDHNHQDEEGHVYEWWSKAQEILDSAGAH